MNYSTRNEAIRIEIVEPIEATGVVLDAYAAYDIEAIAGEVIGTYSEGYRRVVDLDEFWKIVERHEKGDA